MDLYQKRGNAMEVDAANRVEKIRSQRLPRRMDDRARHYLQCLRDRKADGEENRETMITYWKISILDIVGKGRVSLAELGTNEDELDSFK